ncbi:NADPH oxidase [Ophiocordyceps camponoti-floridani]|uniref:NADPH oxidase n=1 Tax=Ophiocordyceps camponoti-floridani TaxID=2030778 RepID=A0A8H4VE74_9HYPO|nr:NADPH oxidase [Ophiocordyceps camponoti-floridani]
MRLPWALVLGALIAVVRADDVYGRQVPTSSAFLPLNLPSLLGFPSATTESSGSSTSSSSSSSSASSSTSTSSSSSSSDGQSSGGGADTTVTTTVTVPGSRSTITEFSTVTSSFVETSTVFSTEIVTETGETATSIVFETSTTFVNRKRSLDAGLARRNQLPPVVLAQVTPAPVLDSDERKVFKRATITSTLTVTGDNGPAATTTIERVSSTVSTSLTTFVVTQTSLVNARTTDTSTSTLVVTSTRGGAALSPTSSSNSQQGGRREGAGGLSSAAKAGIGVGAGLGGLALVAAAAYFCLRRKRGPKPFHDDLIGASEVPIGGPAGRRPMAQTTTATTGSNRYQSANVIYDQPKANSSPEGYRGTAIGDGRAGFAHPAPYGAAYSVPTATRKASKSASTTTTTGGADALPQHPTPGDSTTTTTTTWPLTDERVEMDGRPLATGGPMTSHPVYEMPSQSYR